MATHVQRVQRVTRPADETAVVEEQRTVADTQTIDSPSNILARII